MFPNWGDVACVGTPELSGAGPRRRGIAVSEADCQLLSHERRFSCFWSDGSPRTRAAPPVHTVCPAAPAPASVLCGGPCGDCFSHVGDVNGLSTPCVGRNDDRDLGVCGLSGFVPEGCSPEHPPSETCTGIPVSLWIPMEWSTDRCSCLAFRTDDGFERAGWVVPQSNCTTYRDLYPGEVECYDDAWTPVSE